MVFSEVAFHLIILELNLFTVVVVPIGEVLVGFLHYGIVSRHTDEVFLNLPFVADGRHFGIGSAFTAADTPFLLPIVNFYFVGYDTSGLATGGSGVGAEASHFAIRQITCFLIIRFATFFILCLATFFNFLGDVLTPTILLQILQVQQYFGNIHFAAERNELEGRNPHGPLLLGRSVQFKSSLLGLQIKGGFEIFRSLPQNLH